VRTDSPVRVNGSRTYHLGRRYRSLVLGAMSTLRGHADRPKTMLTKRGHGTQAGSRCWSTCADGAAGCTHLIACIASAPRGTGPPRRCNECNECNDMLSMVVTRFRGADIPVCRQEEADRNVCPTLWERGLRPGREFLCSPKADGKVLSLFSEESRSPAMIHGGVPCNFQTKSPGRHGRDINRWGCRSGFRA
jgi:hypothetical protein